MNEEISYVQLFDLLRKEKTKEDLQQLEKLFYKDTFKILKERENVLKVKEAQQSLVLNTETEKEKIEIRNIRKLLNEIIDRRQKKIILLALSRTRLPSTIINYEAFTIEEGNLFEKCVKVFREFKQNVTEGKDEYSSVISNEVKKEEITKEKAKEETKEETKEEIKEKIQPKEEIKVEPKIVQEPKAEESDSIKLKFLEPMQNFYGPKKEILGPFEKDQVAELPNLIAMVLIKKGRAIKI